MANIKEIKFALKVLTKYHPLKRIALLHCVSEYPTNFEKFKFEFY